jgi:hypothetical protein
MRIGFNLGRKQYGRFTEINNRIERIRKPIRSLSYPVMDGLRKVLTDFEQISSFYPTCKIAPVISSVGGKNKEIGLTRQYERIPLSGIIRILVPKSISTPEKELITALLMPDPKLMAPDVFPEILFGKGALFQSSGANNSRHDIEKELSVIDPVKDLEITFKGWHEYVRIIELLRTNS